MATQTSQEYLEYFSKLEYSLKEILAIAKESRKKGLDPKIFPEIEVASDLAGLVEGFIGLPGIANRIRELTKGMSREKTAFKIAEEIIYGKFGHLNQEEAAGQAIRTALAILTEGVTAAVYSEGIAKVSIKSNLDGSKYLAIYLAGPIRSAGGTETALTPVIADFVRRLLSLDRYKPSEEEIGRFIEELRLYEREVARFQYSVSDEEIRRALQHIPVEVTGTQSDPIEVSSFRNLPRVETNCIRGGALRVINDGIIGRASKVLSVVEDLGIQGWDWLKDIREIEKKKTSGFMEDTPAGRPILSFPSRRGGFRLRYGRARNTGLAAVGVHPLTMRILRNFLAGGTQLKIETPGKSGVVLSVDGIEPPIVRLKDGTVLRVSYENLEHIEKEIDKILFLGDILISFGDFLYNNKSLLPSGFTEEWWCEELKAAIAQGWEGTIDDVAKKTGIAIASLEGFMKEPFHNKPTVQEAISLSSSLKIPLHPSYTYFWSNISLQDIQKLRLWLFNSKVKFGENGMIAELKGNIEEIIKNLLERICIPHKISGSEIIIEGEDAHAFAFTLGYYNPTKRIVNEKSAIENLTHLSGIPIKDKAPSFIGARVGRPEKAKRREMKPVVQLLFPTGLNGGPKRDLMKACERSIIHVEVAKRLCPNCGMTTFKLLCSNCGAETVLEMICPKCERSLDKEECPVCKVKAKNYRSQPIHLKDMVDEACNKVKYVPKQIKGVKGLTSRTKTPEIIEKGILRAKFNLSVYKDGTIRFDATNAPLTHFKPSEIGISVKKLRELGYNHDYVGNSLVDPNQICELKVQDVIIPWKCVGYMIRAANFIDELLQKVYGLPPYYNVSCAQDLVGLIIIGLAPHTCAGIAGRVIGFTELNVCFAHPFWHSSKRRDCDGDEDSIILALDAFLNFSREYLPDQIGGTMDSPLFVIRSINPEEVQRQAHDFDVAFKYPLVFYESTFKNIFPRDVISLIDIVKHRFGSEGQYQGFGFTVPTFNINAGNKESIYKTLKRMIDKLNAQLKLAEMIEAVDVRQVAESVLTTHFIRDISGNLRAFTTQNFRCKKCNKRFRRVPLKGRCSECNSELTLTVYRGGIEKYLEAANQLVKRYGISEYYSQRLALIEEEIGSLFESGKDTKQVNLSKFLVPSKMKTF